MTTAAIPPLSEWKRWIPSQPVIVGWVVLIGVFVWAYWHTLLKLVGVWYSTPDYGHGFFVPLFSAFLLWLRQGMVNPWPAKGTWWAMAFFAVWAVMRWLIFGLGYERDMDSLFPFLIGVTLCLGGWKALHWAWPSIAFLVFMVPLPGSVQVMMGGPLQRIATIASAYTLQTLGIPAIAQGNVIQLSDPANVLEVVQACSGLRMLTLFVAICVGTVFVLRLEWWEKLIILASSVPIALFCNVFRIVLNGVVAELAGAEWGHWAHDNFGLLMMPLALALLWVEMILLSKLVAETTSEGPLSLGGLTGQPRPARGGPPMPTFPQPPTPR